MPGIEIKSEYGTISTSDEDFYSRLVFQSLKQLKSYQANGNHTEYLKRDIKGYQILLDSENHIANCFAFIRMKQNAIRAGCKFKDNLAVIDMLKKNGEWKN